MALGLFPIQEAKTNEYVRVDAARAVFSQTDRRDSARDCFSFGASAPLPFRLPNRISGGLSVHPTTTLLFHPFPFFAIKKRDKLRDLGGKAREGSREFGAGLRVSCRESFPVL